MFIHIEGCRFVYSYIIRSLYDRWHASFCTYYMTLVCIFGSFDGPNIHSAQCYTTWRTRKERDDFYVYSMTQLPIMPSPRLLALASRGLRNILFIAGESNLHTHTHTHTHIELKLVLLFIHEACCWLYGIGRFLKQIVRGGANFFPFYTFLTRSFLHHPAT